MFGKRRVALLAAAALAGGMLSFSAAPSGAQALRAGLTHLGSVGDVAAVQEVQFRGRGGAVRAGGMRAGGMRAVRMGGGVRPRFVGARPGGQRFVGANAGRPFAGNRVAMGQPGFRPGRPGWGPGPGRPGWGPGRPGWGPGGGPGWGHPGWRPPPGAWGPGPWRPGWGWWRPGWGWGYYNNTGAWVALGVASGLALGAVAATAAEPVYGGDAVAYCMQRFRSYNPNTGTYTGYDGLQHPCP